MQAVRRPERKLGPRARHGARKAGSPTRPSKANQTLLAAIALQSHLAGAYDLGAAGPSRPQHLAQRMGLVPAPPLPLTDAQWECVQKESQQRQDSYYPCAICHEHFGRQPQVLLSCSHVFHKACIAAYEKFAHTKQCPLCRTQEYRKRVISDGLDAGRHLSARRIQAVWRGHRARKLYFQMLLEHDPAMRRQYHYGIVKSVSDRYLQAAEANAQHLDGFFAQLDRARAAARLLHFTAQDWEDARRRALRRGDSDCPICMQVLFPSSRPMGLSLQSQKSPPSTLEDNVVLLSCSHCFHAACMQSLERFALVERDSSPKAASLCLQCPVCRAAYLKQPLTV